MTDLVDTKTAAQILGMKPTYLAQLRMKDDQPFAYYKLGYLIRYSRAELAAYLETCRVNKSVS